MDGNVWFFFCGADIMTVTVVLSEGKMSLFQDLKLKRRKVDSRCSSDGEPQFVSRFSFCQSPHLPRYHHQSEP